MQSQESRWHDWLGKFRDLACELARTTYTVAKRLASSRLVQKVTISGLLIALVSAALWVVAALIYIVFYYRYVPNLVATAPLHLQYGYGSNPFAIVDFSSSRTIHAQQPYDIVVTLTLPRSPSNLGVGNFMVALHILAENSPSRSWWSELYTRVDELGSGAKSKALPVPDLAAYVKDKTFAFSSTRPALVPFVDPTVSLVRRFLLLPYHLLFPRHADAVTLTIPMAERLSFSAEPVPRSAVVEIQAADLGVAGKPLQVYDGSVALLAKLNGLRWFMWRMRLASFFLFTTVFWGVLEGSLLVTVLGYGTFSELKRMQTIKNEEDLEDGAGKVVKNEPDDDASSVGAQQKLDAGEADDEEEEEEEELSEPQVKIESDDDVSFLDSGIGTSYSSSALDRVEPARRRRPSRVTGGDA